MRTATAGSTPRDEDALDAVLRPAHTAWMEDARCFLGPTLEPGADFWVRWGAIRYLSDDFQERYRLERGLLEGVRSFVEPERMEQLLRESDRIFRLRLELDRVGRRRGTAEEFASGARDLLEQLGLWCAQIELATGGITLDALPPEAAGLLTHLEATQLTRR